MLKNHVIFFFFKQKTAYEMRISDWSSDVCSSDLAAQCRQGKELGFDGKTLIHPKTIAQANEVFAPSAEEIAWSHKIIAPHAEATAAGKGGVVVDGKMVENIHVENARRMVANRGPIQELESAPEPEANRWGRRT